ncbi:MAG TPA: uroporphyrinogen decarboxylase [Candidatus Limnocylindrales bacterium]|nr:uroporphyrinogen decarboxylase [Candidatus Limnocylindrales bacterium]
MSERRDARFLQAARRQRTDATPVWFMRQAGRSLPEYRRVRERASLADIVGDAALCAEVSLQPVRRLGVDAAIVFADITTPLPGAGVAVELVESVGPVVAQPIRSAADVERLRPLDPAASVGPLLEAISILRRESPVPVIGFAGAPFTLAAYLIEGRSPRDLERTKVLMHAAPATFAALLARLVDLDLAYLGAQVAAGAEAVQLFDSWVGQLSPYDYRAHVQPHVRRLFDGLAERAVPTIHFGTGTAGLLGAMAEAGGDVIGLDWRIGLADGWSRVPDRAVQGNLDPTLLLGPFDAVAGQAREILDDAAGRPGHIFNLGHGVLPETDPDALRRLVDLVHERTAGAGTSP